MLVNGLLIYWWPDGLVAWSTVRRSTDVSEDIGSVASCHIHIRLRKEFATLNIHTEACEPGTKQKLSTHTEACDPGWTPKSARPRIRAPKHPTLDTDPLWWPRSLNPKALLRTGSHVFSYIDIGKLTWGTLGNYLIRGWGGEVLLHLRKVGVRFGKRFGARAPS